MEQVLFLNEGALKGNLKSKISILVVTGVKAAETLWTVFLEKLFVKQRS